MTAPYLPRDSSDFEAYCADKFLSDEISIYPDGTRRDAGETEDVPRIIRRIVVEPRGDG
jgi:hypothetical protein